MTNKEQKKTITIHGKEYKPVAVRVEEFREAHGPNFSIQTEILTNTDEMVLMKCSIRDGSEKVISVGYAEEKRGATNINKTSAVENCETSAVGRALAFFGYGGSEIASSNEITEKLVLDAKMKATEYFMKYNGFVRENYYKIAGLKGAFNDNDILAAAEAWLEFSEDEQNLLFGLAPTKGGVLSTQERASIKSDDFAQAIRDFKGI